MSRLSIKMTECFGDDSSWALHTFRNGRIEKQCMLCAQIDMVYWKEEILLPVISLRLDHVAHMAFLRRFQDMRESENDIVYGRSKRRRLVKHIVHQRAEEFQVASFENSVLFRNGLSGSAWMETLDILTSRKWCLRN